MTNALATEYHVFARWTLKGDVFCVGTVDELRAGEWYAGRLREIPELAMRFGDAMGAQRATDVLLSIMDGPEGRYRAAALARSLEGVTVVVTLVMRSRDPSGVSLGEVLLSQTLTIVGCGTTPTDVRLKLVDLEEEKLRGLYPPNTWQATDWPQLSDRDAGRAICYPVGTALKLPAVQVRADAAGNEWWFGVCEGRAQTAGINLVNVALQRLFVNRDLTDILRVGQVICVTGSSAINGRYTVTGVAPTYVIVAEPIASSTGGVVRVMPHPLTVYRGGRVVPPSEYSVHHFINPGVLSNGDFAAGGTDWTTWYYTPGSGYVQSPPPGAATIVYGAGGATISSPSANDHAFVHHYNAGIPVRGARYAVQITVAPGFSDAVVTDNGVPIMRHRCSAGDTTTIILECGYPGAGANLNFGIGVWNNTGTVTITSVRFIPLDGVLLLFANEQLDFQGSPYTLECDVQGVDSRNVVNEISRLLTHAGVTADGATSAAAAAVAETQRMIVDCDYGRGGQRRVNAILEDLLVIARGGLARTAAGSYALWQDVASAPVATFDESLGDAIEVTGVDWPARSKTLGLRYRPGSRDPRELQNTITRSIAGGVLGEESPRDMPYLRDHVAADRLLCYRALRRGANGVATATVYRQQRSVGEVLTITSPLNWSGPRQWKVRSVQRTPNANVLELMEYAAGVYVYTPSAQLGKDASQGYVPDYSQTPPAAPIAMAITGGAVVVSQDGTISARVTVQATAPAVNWSEIWFAVIHNVTGEIIRQQGAMTGTLATANIGGLRAGEVYQLKSYAINAFSVQGVLQSTFNASVIGGGAITATFTAPGPTTLPPDVSSITVDQGTGLLLNVKWPAVVMGQDTLAEYVLERSVGMGTFFEIWRGRALSFVDRDLTYGTGYVYRVKARDRWGNLSANWRTSASRTALRNVSGGLGGDIMTSTVETVNRSAVSLLFIPIPMSGVFSATRTIVHGLDRVPIACVVGTDAKVIGTIEACNMSEIRLRAIYIGDGGMTESALGPGAHTHDLKRAPSPGVTYNVSTTFW